MTITIGLLLIPVVLLIMKKSNMITTKKKGRILLNIFLILISIIYLVWTVSVDIEISYSVEYMLCTGDFILYAGVVVITTPFIWMVIIHFAKMIIRMLRVRKNAMLKGYEEYICYRGDLDKVSPSTIMFTSTFELDLRKSISATILKLKLNGYIEEKNGNYFYTNKDESNLIASEKMVLNLIKNNSFDKNEYKKTLEQEVLKNKYLTKNQGGRLGRLVKIAIAIAIPFIVASLTTKLDYYTFDNYHVWPEDDGHAYFEIVKYKDLKKLEEEVKDENDFYASPLYWNGELTTSYNHSLIRADKLEYSVVRKALFYNLITSFVVGFECVVILIAVYVVIEQLAYMNKNYRRTIKGKNLLTKAYALKNYLKQYSLIKERDENELVLWEHYLIYAVILDVNLRLEDKLIEKYVKMVV